MYLFKKKSPFNILFLKNKFSVTIGKIVLGLSQLFPQRLKERKHEEKMAQTEKGISMNNAQSS